MINSRASESSHPLGATNASVRYEDISFCNWKLNALGLLQFGGPVSSRLLADVEEEQNNSAAAFVVFNLY